MKGRAKLYTVTCRCGNMFVTTRSTIRWCTVCAKNKTTHIFRREAVRQTVTAHLPVVAKGSHSEAEWKQVLRSQSYRCFYCRRPLAPPNWNRDHRTPLARGGSDNISNIVAACRKCNMAKGDLTATEYIQKQNLVIKPRLFSVEEVANGKPMRTLGTGKAVKPTLIPVRNLTTENAAQELHNPAVKCVRK